MPRNDEAKFAYLNSNSAGEEARTNGKDTLEFGRLGRAIIESLPIAVIAFDRNLKIIEANTRAGELIDLRENVDESLAGGTDEKIWQNWTQQIRTAVLTGKAFSFDNVNYTRSGRTKLFRIACTPFKQAQTHENTGGVIAIEDITEKVGIERQLANAERLAAVGKLASKVAHELNNPLDGILRYINLAIRSAERNNMAKPLDYLMHCRRGLMRMVHITSELLEFSRRTYSAFEYTQIEQIIEESIRVMESRIGMANVRIQLSYATGLPKIRSGNLFQVFCNLIKNAIDVMPEGGSLTVSTTKAANNTAVIEFCDTGPGLPVEKAEAIFEPFFTTKTGGKGTGLGLAICKDIVEKYNGQITAQNAPDKGSIFRIYLPLEENTV